MRFPVYKSPEKFQGENGVQEISGNNERQEREELADKAARQRGCGGGNAAKVVGNWGARLQIGGARGWKIEG